MTRWRILVLIAAMSSAASAHAVVETAPAKTKLSFKQQVRNLFRVNRTSGPTKLVGQKAAPKTEDLVNQAVAEALQKRDAEHQLEIAKLEQKYAAAIAKKDAPKIVEELPIKATVAEAVQTAEKVYKGSPKEREEQRKEQARVDLDKRVEATTPAIVHVLGDKALQAAASKHDARRIWITGRQDGVKLYLDPSRGIMEVHFFDLQGDTARSMAYAFGNKVSYDEGYRYDKSATIHLGYEKNLVDQKIRSLVHHFPWLDAKLIETRIAEWSASLKPPQ